MFYLSQCAKLAYSHPLRVSSFLLVGVGLFVLSFIGPSLEKRWMPYLSSQQFDLPYFHALVSGRENHSRISRNLQDLPGVEKVEILAEESIKSQVRDIVGSLSEDITESFLSLDYAGLKVIFTDGLQASSQELIRDYLKRLVGDSKVTLGPVQATKRKKVEKTWIRELIEQNAFEVVMGMACLFWFILGLDLSGPLSRQAYLVEQFQRRNKVAIKTYLSLFIPLLIIPILGLLFSVPSVMILIVFMAGSLPLAAVARRVSWH